MEGRKPYHVIRYVSHGQRETMILGHRGGMLTDGEALEYVMERWPWWVEVEVIG